MRHGVWTMDVRIIRERYVTVSYHSFVRYKGMQADNRYCNSMVSDISWVKVEVIYMVTSFPLSIMVTTLMNSWYEREIFNRLSTSILESFVYETLGINYGREVSPVQYVSIEVL
jgi:hypothetical protein